jgi:MoaA/NifB/PqqE/SkfB family radical SAM enzyme/SAM-dependent methyltransferase
MTSKMINRQGKAMNPILSSYQRVLFEQVPIYVRPDLPDWFVPTTKADELLQRITTGKRLDTQEQVLASRILSRLDQSGPVKYNGRGQYCKAEVLKECWLHVTNKCNMRCRHCLFSSGDGDSSALEFDVLSTAIDDALRLGCKIFYLTGGEPLIYPQFKETCEQILKAPETHIVILTNGNLIRTFVPWLKQQDHNRLHFQFSIDGLEDNHERLRGQQSFQQLCESLRVIGNSGFGSTLAMSVNRHNVQEIPGVVDFAKEHGVSNIHLLWLFVKGQADQTLFVEPEVLFPYAREGYEKACACGITIDNFDNLKTQVLNFPGIKMDLNNACYESLAIGPDGNIYPSPALIYEKDMICGHISNGLETAWKEGPLADKIRSLTVVHCQNLEANLLKFLTGGGDMDYSYIFSGEAVGQDPYLPLHEKMALYLISREAQNFEDHDRIAIRARMGEHIEECEEGGGPVAFTHSNCVLALAGRDEHASVGSFYSQAAEDVNEDIINPVHYNEDLIAHIPVEARMRSYGCGSPVMDCALKTGESLVDLGSGTGVECYIASKLVGPTGKVYGLDMLDNMLERANKAKDKVADELGYANIEFLKGYLEDIPLEDKSIDAVISNCVINLSSNKRKTFSEVARILKGGGRIVISDIIHCEPVPLEIKKNEKLRGECIGGAMYERDLFGLLADLGFEHIRVVKRFLYREIKGYPFYSLTYQAQQPSSKRERSIIYRGPFAGVITDEGQIIPRGETRHIPLPESFQAGEEVLLLDDKGQATNLAQDMSCCCAPVPAGEVAECDCAPIKSDHHSGCLICGEPIIILQQPRRVYCHYCRKEHRVESLCQNDHFVCDQCHIRVAVDQIKDFCLKTEEKDVLKNLMQIRSYPNFPMHGPHHHPMIPGILLAGYRNNGGQVTEDQIITGIERGSLVPGASCAFFGIDGAAVGVGIAFSVILSATPYSAQERQLVQKIVNRVSAKISAYPAARCCLRESYIAFKEAEQISRELTPVTIMAQENIQCDQFRETDYCSGKSCPLMQATVAKDDLFHMAKDV